MAVTVFDNGWISDSFQMGEAPQIYVDALYMPAEQYNSLTPQEIENMKKERYESHMRRLKEMRDQAIAAALANTTQNTIG